MVLAVKSQQKMQVHKQTNTAITYSVVHAVPGRVRFRIPLLAKDDAAISFGDGSEIARETADVVLMNNNLTSFVDAIAIARETKALIQQNISLAVVPNLAALGLATTVGMHPLVATVVHNGSAIAAGLNGLRPLMHRD